MDRRTCAASIGRRLVIKPRSRRLPGDDHDAASSAQGGGMTKKLDTTAARQGETRHQVRYVLAISLIAAVVALAIVAVVVLN
jgi:hypothetical protein